MNEDFSNAVVAVPGGVKISCRVQPRSSKCKIDGLYAGVIKIRLTAPPVEGKANAALCEYLADLFGVAKSAVSVVSGDTARNKTVQIIGVGRSAVIHILEAQNG